MPKMDGSGGGCVIYPDHYQLMLEPFCSLWRPAALVAGLAESARGYAALAVALLCAWAFWVLRRRFHLIQHSQREWVKTFDSIEDPILVHDADFRVRRVNQALARRLGRQPWEIVGHFCEAVLSRDHGPWDGCPYCSRKNGASEAADRCFGGYSFVTTSTFAGQDGKAPGTIHIVRDTTERHVVEEKYRLLFEQVQEGVFVCSPDGQLLDCNKALVRMLGYSTRDEVLALNLKECYASAEQAAAFLGQMQSQNFFRNFEVELRRQDGSRLPALQESFATHDAEGKVDRYQGFFLDISEKKRAEDEMRRRNRELHALNAIAVISTQSFDLDEILNRALKHTVSLFSAQSGSIYLVDAKPKIRRRAAWGHSGAVDAFAEIEISEEFWLFVVRSRAELFTHRNPSAVPPFVSEMLQANHMNSWMGVILWSKDQPLGAVGIASRDAREFTANDESLMVAICRQLSTAIEKIRLYEESCRAYENLQRAQEQLLQSEKMSAVGQLISGVAHELNNPLTAILGYAQLLENEGLAAHAQDYVRKLFKQAQRTHRVVQNLLSFARQHKPEKLEVDLRRVLEETLVLREYDLKLHNIQVTREFERDLPTVIADPHQLEQVFLNIINNAADAILDKEKEGRLQVRMFSRGNQVWVEFQDSGPGITDPKRIFDPFYTTKTVGKGTGLGLSICYGIVKEHGGEISASNAASGGAIIQVSLPACGKARQAVPTAATPAREAVLHGRVLLVEHEQAVLDFEREVLAGAGAEVVAATQIDEAQSLLKQQQFDGLIVSTGSPGTWNRAELLSWLSRNHPGLEKHVLFIFSGPPPAELEEAPHPTFILVKPFDIGSLIGATRRLLQKARAAQAT
jgi:PAS domain S-box-containing protein